MSRRVVLATAAALLVLATALVVVLQRDVGVARDETVYMHHGSKYADWWLDLVTFDGAANEKAITAAWGGQAPTANNREHPPLMKTLFGLSEKVLHDQLGVAGEQTAYRFPTAVMWGVLVALVFLFTCAVWGYFEGLVAALLVLLLPRGLFHAGLAAFDAPITTLWFATLVVYWRSLAARRWWWAVGVVFGLALATKHNALILPFVIGAHFAVLAWRDRTRLRRSWPTLAGLALGPVVLLVLWPWLWLDPIGHVADWIGFHLDHVHYNFEYLGDNWNHPPFPWHVAIVTTLLTVPVITLAAGGLGAGVLAWKARRRQSADAARAPGLLLLVSLAAAMGPFFLGSTPIFGAEKHWGPAIPSICVAAGVGVVWAARRLKPYLEERIAIAVVGTFVLAAAAAEVHASHPHALTHYNAIAGGAPGGADLGMNRQFWGVSARGVLPWLRIQPPGKVYTHDASPAWGYYTRWGLVTKAHPDAGNEFQGGIERSQYALVIHERHFNRHDYLIWNAYGTVQPAYVLRTAGVPIVSVYRRPAR